MTLSILERGTLRERMEWVARLYDLDGDGVISAEELEDVIFSVTFFSFSKFLDTFNPKILSPLY